MRVNLNIRLLSGFAKCPLIEPLWSLVVGVWDIVEGSWGAR